MPIRWLRAHPVAADLMMATALTVVAIVVHLLDIENSPDMDTRDPAWWTVPLVVASVLPIGWRRSHTMVSAGVVVAAQIVTELADVDGTGYIGVLVGVYSLGAHAVGRARTRLLVAIVLALDALFVAGLATGELDLGSFVSSVIVLGTAFVLGDNLRRRRDAASAAEERAARAERERELIAQQQVASERGRIARELHDVVAHSVSVMVIQAAAARRSLHTSPANAEQALTNIEETGRRTMNELRAILGVLRRADPPETGDTTLSPQPTMADIGELVRLSDDLPVDLVVDGRLDDLPSSVALSGYRVVQEALTNIRRHAGPVHHVEVVVERRDESVVMTVTDDGRGAAADDAGPGYGLLGMRERAAAIGGVVDAGARPGGGWRIVATLPIGGSTVPAPRPEAPGLDRHADEYVP